MDNNILKVNVKFSFETIEQADACRKILKKYIDKETKIFNFKRSKTDMFMTVDIENEDWNNISMKDLESLKPDFLKFENLTKRDQDKMGEACSGLKKISLSVNMDIEL
jgi:hypothetical protein